MMLIAGEHDDGSEAIGGRIDVENPWTDDRSSDRSDLEKVWTATHARTRRCHAIHGDGWSSPPGAIDIGLQRNQSKPASEGAPRPPAH
jgi:hypothetical protein